MKIKKIIVTFGLVLLLSAPMTAMASTAYFSNFNFVTKPYEDLTKIVTAAVKDGGSNYESKWYYRITGVSGLGGSSTGDIMFLEPNYPGGGLHIAMPALISSDIQLDTPLTCSYYESAPAGQTYTLYAISNDTYPYSNNVYISGRFTP